jgi:hypothetical protein
MSIGVDPLQAKRLHASHPENATARLVFPVIRNSRIARMRHGSKCKQRPQERAGKC